MSLFNDSVYDHVNYKYASYPYWTLYILECENNFIYVGITRCSVYHRYYKHKKRKGALSTKMYQPIRILKIISTLETEQSKAAVNYENRCVRLCKILLKNKKILGGYMYPKDYY